MIPNAMINFQFFPFRNVSFESWALSSEHYDLTFNQGIFLHAFLKKRSQFPCMIFSMSIVEYPFFCNNPGSNFRSAIVFISCGACSDPNAPSRSDPIPICLALPASWQIWSMWSMIISRLQFIDRGVDLPLIHPGTIIHASSAPPITAPRCTNSFICSSLN